MAYTCFRCRQVIPGEAKGLFVHLRAVHGMNSASTFWQCHGHGCRRSFGYVWSFRRHLAQHSVPDHYHGTEQHSRGASRASISVPMNVDNSDPVEVQNEHDGYWEDLEPETITERIALFLATLKAKSAQTYSTVRFVVQQTSSLVSDIDSSLQRKTMYLFEKFGHRDDPGVKELAHDFEAAASPFEGIESEFKQMQYIVKSGNFIDPVEEAFTGESFVQRRASATVRQVLLQDTFYRVPLKPLLKKMESFQTSMMGNTVSSILSSPGKCLFHL